MRVPYTAGSGKARITLSYPGLEGWDVVPMTLELPVEEARRWKWIWNYGPWILGGILIVGIAGLGIRIKAGAGRTRRCT